MVQEGHHNFVDQILDQFSSLMMDISWVTSLLCSERAVLVNVAERAVLVNMARADVCHSRVDI